MKKTISTHKYFFPAALICALLLTSCSSDDEGTAPQTTGHLVISDLPMDKANLVMSHTIFSQLLRDFPGENVLISPWSLQSALLMTTEAAQGTTADEFRNLLHLGEHPMHHVRADYHAIDQMLNQAGGHPIVRSSNAFFFDPNRLPVNPPYTEILTDNYQSALSPMAFDNPVAHEEINSWVSENTEGLIEAILEEPIPYNQVFYLINTLYFSADWLMPFPAEFTSTGNFTRTNGEVTQTPFMRGVEVYLHASVDGLQMIDLPLRDSTFSLSLVSPTAFTAGNQDWATALTPEKFEGLYSALAKSYIAVNIPKMELNFNKDLIPQLKSLGVQSAFLLQLSDFTGMSDLLGREIVIEPVLHEAALKVDEKGVEGAAVTVVGGIVLSSPPIVTFDKPFVLALRHIDSGVQLFLGYVDLPKP